MPSYDEMTKEIFYGEANNNNSKKAQLNMKKEKTISSKISKFAKAVRIPSEKKKKKKNSNKI
jgi:hypothetical protein